MTTRTTLELIIDALRKTAGTDVEAAQRLETAEAVQHEIDEIHSAAAAAATQGGEARLAQCHELARVLDAVATRLAEYGLDPDPAKVQYTDLLLMLESPDDIPYEIARLQAIASAITMLTHAD